MGDHAGGSINHAKQRRPDQPRSGRPDRAFHNCITDSIHLPPKSAFSSAANYYGTALHELAHWSGHNQRLIRKTLNETYSFGDLAYAKEELRAELASVFLMAERGIPRNPDSHAAYLGAWLHSLSDDKNEIFRAARDDHKAADLLMALELHKSIDQALAHVNGTFSAPMEQTIRQQGTPSPAHSESRSFELEI